MQMHTLLGSVDGNKNIIVLFATEDENTILQLRKVEELVHY